MKIRERALALLRAAQQDDKYISRALDTALAEVPDERDRALLAALVFGVAEKQVTLDYYIEKIANRPTAKINIRLLFILRLGLYQLRYLDRIPPHAAVNETVRLGKSGGERSLINAVLRTYLRDGEKIQLPKDKTERMAVKYSFPLPIVRLFEENLGNRAGEALAALSTQPPLTIAVNTLCLDRNEALFRLHEAGVSAAACEDSGRGIRIRQNISFSALCDLLGENGFFVQDEASQIAICALSPKPGQRGADVCAAPGSKTFYAALCMQNEGEIHAFDLHESKVPLIESGAKRLGVGIISAKTRDARMPDESLYGKMDFVICDVPCSGLGVLAKKPDMRHRAAARPDELAPLGYEILSESAKYLRPGAKLLYSTCTLTRQENEHNFYKFLDSHSDFEFIDFTVGSVQSMRGCATLFPNGERDGFFIGLIRRKA